LGQKQANRNQANLATTKKVKGEETEYWRFKKGGSSITSFREGDGLDDIQSLENDAFLMLRVLVFPSGHCKKIEPEGYGRLFRWHLKGVPMSSLWTPQTAERKPKESRVVGG